MRILLLSQWFYPEPEIRIRALAKSLLERDHEVTVITGFPNYPEGKLYSGYQQRLYQIEDDAGLQIIRVPLYPNHSISPIKRILNYMSFAITASSLGLILAPQADIMWVYHPPLTVTLPATVLSVFKRIPFVYEIQDMWPESVAASGMLSAPLPLAVLNRTAHFTYHRASAITVISNGFKNNLIQKGVPSAKIHVIENWADEQIYTPKPKDITLGRNNDLIDRFNIMFAGNMGPVQGLDVVLDAAALLARDGYADVQFVLIGDGLDVERLKARVRDMQLTNVKFVPRQPATFMPDFFAWADVLLVQLRNDPLFHMTIPSKTLSYLACGRPILCAVPGEVTELISEIGAGMVCPPENAEALANCVKALRAMTTAKRESMGRAGREAFLRLFTRDVLVDRYEELFQMIVKNRVPMSSETS